MTWMNDQRKGQTCRSMSFGMLMGFQHLYVVLVSCTSCVRLLLVQQPTTLLLHACAVRVS